MAFSSQGATTLLQTLGDLRTATDTASVSQVLKRIKYEVSGHLSRKIDYVHHGLLHLLDKALADFIVTPPTDDNDLIFTHAAQVLCVIAHEGPSFVQPILETDILQSLLKCLLQPRSSKTILTILRCLNAVAENMPPSSPGQWVQDGRLADLLYSKQYIQCTTRIVGIAGDTLSSQQACDAMLAVLAKTVTSEQHKRALVDTGMLTILAARLASFVVAEGLVPPGSEALDSDNSVFSILPDPAPPFAHLSPVLEAICLLIERSAERAAMFLSDPSIKVVFPDIKDNFAPFDIRRAPSGAAYFSGGAVPRSCPQGPFDPLLPLTLVLEKSNSPFPPLPPLGSSIAIPKRRASFRPATSNLQQPSAEQPDTDDLEESSVISWLLYMVRASKGRRRMLAAKLLVHLYSLNFVKKERGTSFTSLLVPILTRMLEVDVLKSDSVRQGNGVYLGNGLHYAKEIPAVLAVLIMDDPDMQRVAVEGGAIATLSTGLKSTFENTSGRKPKPWQPRKAQESHADVSISATKLGGHAPSPAIRREMEYRKGCLQALAAIAPFDDDYRKEICNQGVLNYLLLSLELYQIENIDDPQMEINGNSAPVLMAACGIVRVLTRSVQALRTKIIEAEVTKPIIKLMSSTNPEVIIAATQVLANLAIDFSPAKESVLEPSVVKKLCEQAHSANARLRFESLWTLKQLVCNSSRKLKQDVVDELGPSWIKLLIKTNPGDIPEGEVIGLVERDYPPLPGSQRTFSAADKPDDIVMSEGSGDSSRLPPTSLVGDAGLDQHGFNMRHTPEDDTEIQAQLLDLLRNLFCGENASELVKYIFDEMGQDEFFRIMLDRLRPRTLAGPTRKENVSTPAPTTIVVKVLYILAHICACEPKWRNLITGQQALMKQVLSFSGHEDREVRAQVCWIAINLTYEDDVSERAACKQRAQELQRYGYVTHVRKLEGDPDINVRERAKTAMHLMSKLLVT
ncbi:uncharacterized protein PV06_09019 [Exophiala oligosperma]|uniref:Uncharacterized protein n=2 Tax=Chaetothyriales TaxID=34395 RepID=A0A0D2AGG8_9EURO|nr:uncharacterized protein PV06_09019 [Exophiala oligosperma]KAJ9643804.1 hypothetical protein H2204_001949 [Knufia peltigerae]KIW39226.1 hypothetical protein PV06_09019 [Exophiala oligosperma]